MTAIQIGSKVKRDTNDYLADEIGEVIEIEAQTSRARVKWSDKRTWYKLSKLLPID